MTELSERRGRSIESINIPNISIDEHFKYMFTCFQKLRPIHLFIVFIIFSFVSPKVLELVLRVAAVTSVVYLRRHRAAAPWARLCAGRWLNDAAGESTRPHEPWTRNTRVL